MFDRSERWQQLDRDLVGDDKTTFVKPGMTEDSGPGSTYSVAVARTGVSRTGPEHDDIVALGYEDSVFSGLADLAIHVIWQMAERDTGIQLDPHRAREQIESRVMANTGFGISMSGEIIGPAPGATNPSVREHLVRWLLGRLGVVYVRDTTRRSVAAAYWSNTHAQSRKIPMCVTTKGIFVVEVDSYMMKLFQFSSVVGNEHVAAALAAIKGPHFRRGKQKSASASTTRVIGVIHSHFIALSDNTNRSTHSVFLPDGSEVSLDHMIKEITILLVAKNRTSGLVWHPAFTVGVFRVEGRFLALVVGGSRVSRIVTPVHNTTETYRTSAGVVKHVNLIEEADGYGVSMATMLYDSFGPKDYNVHANLGSTYKEITAMAAYTASAIDGVTHLESTAHEYGPVIHAGLGISPSDHTSQATPPLPPIEGSGGGGQQWKRAQPLATTPSMSEGASYFARQAEELTAMREAQDRQERASKPVKAVKDPPATSPRSSQSKGAPRSGTGRPPTGTSGPRKAHSQSQSDSKAGKGSGKGQTGKKGKGWETGKGKGRTARKGKE
jgi:hypothetical protein